MFLGISVGQINNDFSNKYRKHKYAVFFLKFENRTVGVLWLVPDIEA